MGAGLGKIPHRQQDRRHQRGGGRRHFPRQQGRRLHQRHRPEGEAGDVGKSYSTSALFQVDGGYGAMSAEGFGESSSFAGTEK